MTPDTTENTIILCSPPTESKPGTINVMPSWAAVFDMATSYSNAAWGLGLLSQAFEDEHKQVLGITDTHLAVWLFSDGPLKYTHDGHSVTVERFEPTEKQEELAAHLGSLYKTHVALFSGMGTEALYLDNDEPQPQADSFGDLICRARQLFESHCRDITEAIGGASQ